MEKYAFPLQCREWERSHSIQNITVGSTDRNDVILWQSDISRRISKVKYQRISLVDKINKHRKSNLADIHIGEFIHLCLSATLYRMKTLQNPSPIFCLCNFHSIIHVIPRPNRKLA